LPPLPLPDALPISDLPRDLVRRKRGRADHLREEVEAEPEVLAEDAERRADAVAPRARLQAPADELDRRVELGRRAPRRSARQQRAREVREPRPVGGP